jgi:hypothetical protein
MWLSNENRGRGRCKINKGNNLLSMFNASVVQWFTLLFTALIEAGERATVPEKVVPFEFKGASAHALELGATVPGQGPLSIC